MKKNRTLFLLTSISTIAPIAMSAMVVSCGKGEKANSFSFKYLTGKDATKFYNSSTQTLDLSSEKFTSIPDAAFSNISLDFFNPYKRAAVKDKKQRDAIPVAADGLFEPETYILNIKRIVLPSTVKTIGRGAFYGLRRLSEIVFANDSKLENIGDLAFSNTGVTNLVLPTTVKNIGAGAFEKSNLTSINLNQLTSVTTLKKAVFANTNLTTLDLSNILRIEENALTNTKITALTFNDKLSTASPLFNGENTTDETKTKIALTLPEGALKESLKKALSENNKLLYTIQ
ncbi:leucine-rich repeat domain-containing protein [Mycoplasma struthionis]|uniref:Leucine-rich repeat domain-containing protein n=1 Tax=Mycoplasma struthionis TaxID=538220 RepID=A0A502M241_9MOLU|nr:leucine-rich repeat domain-containing protein [Mycoplasma struthionis]TPI02378.1 leucine-rich repeat domain-containing protein [Mycoplasma struthionis]